jgi:integrase
LKEISDLTDFFHRSIDQRFDQCFGDSTPDSRALLEAAGMQRYPYLMQQRRVWFVRMVIPPDVRHLFPNPVTGQHKAIIKRTTGENDIQRAQVAAAPLIAGLQREIAQARARLKPPIADRAEAMYAEYMRRTGVDAERFAVGPYTEWVLESDGQSIERYQQALRGGIVPPVMAEQIQKAIGKRTKFTAHLDAWAKAVTVNPKTRDEYRAAILDFVKQVDEPLETLTGPQVQVWVDYLLNDEDEDGIDHLTVNKKLSGLRNYWHWMAVRGFVDEETRKPFHNRQVVNPHGKVKVAPQRYEPSEVVRLWSAAAGDLADVIRVAAYTGGRRESIMRLRVGDIKRDPTTGVRFMHMSGKSEAGDRDVPIHSQIADLIDRRVTKPDPDGYLFASQAANQYGFRATLIGKQFATLKTDLGFGEAHDFHSVRRTVTHLFETAEAPEGVAKDIIGHKKLDITFGLYSGQTRIDHRARWLEKAIVYPTAANGQSSTSSMI